MVVATAADQGYFGRVSNLVGSLQHWEPSVAVNLYDLGLDSSSKAEARRWRGVEVRALAESLPPHFRTEVQLVGWKAWVILDCLKRHQAVLW